MTPMAIGIGVGLSFAPGQGGGVSIPEPYPAPSGFKWAALARNNKVVAINNRPVVLLVRAA